MRVASRDVINYLGAFSYAVSKKAGNTAFVLKVAAIGSSALALRGYSNHAVCRLLDHTANVHDITGLFTYANDFRDAGWMDTARRIGKLTWLIVDVGSAASVLRECGLVNLEKCAASLGRYSCLKPLVRFGLDKSLTALSVVGYVIDLSDLYKKALERELTGEEKFKCAEALFGLAVCGVSFAVPGGPLFHIALIALKTVGVAAILGKEPFFQFPVRGELVGGGLRRGALEVGRRVSDLLSKISGSVEGASKLGKVIISSIALAALRRHSPGLAELAVKLKSQKVVYDLLALFNLPKAFFQEGTREVRDYDGRRQRCKTGKYVFALPPKDVLCFNTVTALTGVELFRKYFGCSFATCSAVAQRVGSLPIYKGVTLGTLPGLSRCAPIPVLLFAGSMISFKEAYTKGDRCKMLSNACQITLLIAGSATGYTQTMAIVSLTKDLAGFAAWAIKNY